MVDISGIPRRVTETTPAQKHNDLRRTVEQLTSARRLQSASIGKPENGQIFLASDGQRFVDAEGIERIRFNTADGAANFDGPVSIQGPLTLRPGSIENDSLASPIATGSAGLTQQGFALTPTRAVFAQQSVTVPPGYTQAMVMNGVSGNGWNGTSKSSYMYVSSVINGVSGGEVAAPVSGPGMAVATAFGIRTLSGLTAGATISVGVAMRVDGDSWGAFPSNTANTNALVLFLR